MWRSCEEGGEEVEVVGLVVTAAAEEEEEGEERGHGSRIKCFL